LATTDDARVHCAVLKIRAVPAASALAGVASRSWSEGYRQAAVPSGPNSVLGPRTLSRPAFRSGRNRMY
jgi:hypothetical protein